MPESQERTTTDSACRNLVADGYNRGLVVSLQCLCLLLALYANKNIVQLYPTIWILIPIFLAAALARVHFSEAEKPVVRLWQLVGSLSAVYSLLHYPLMPLARNDAVTASLYTVVLVAWGISMAGGILCFRVPSLSIIPPAFLLWINFMAKSVTGLETTIHIDVQPLTEVSVCIGLGLLINHVHVRRGRSIWNTRIEAFNSRSIKLGDHSLFAQLLFLIAIAVHLANYYWSFCAKMSLNGPAGAWLTDNNPAYMFLVALDDGHIVFSGYPRLVQWAFDTFDASHIYSSFFILVLQAAAITAFIIPKRAFFVLLLMFDALHVAIMIIAGANFWPWIILNVIIWVVAGSYKFLRPSITLRLIATGFILIAPHFIQVARLGWYDTGANNKLYFEAIDESGKRYKVPTNFFTFYSYSFGHMDYGSPDPANAFAVGSPNGAAYDYALFQAGRSCNVEKLKRPDEHRGFDAQALGTFVQAYHRMVLAIYSKIGFFPYDLYPHHFYVPLSESEDFYRLDKQRIVAYIYRRESVCLSHNAGALQRKMISAAEYRIDVAGINHDGLSGD